MDSANKENIDEYVLSADPSKYVTLPVQNEQIWRKYQSTLESFWTVYDVYLSNDEKDIKEIFNEEQRNHILKLLAFMFTTHYTTINKELFMQLMSQVDIKEASYYFGSQADAKKTHSLMYSMLLDTMTNSSVKKEKIISDVVSLDAVRDFLRWSIQSTISESKSFAQRLLAFATLQGIVFTVPFVLFDWIKTQHKDKMPGLTNSNDLIWRDENLNLSFSCMLFQYMEDSLTTEEAHTIVKEAVGHAKNIFTKVLPVSILGMRDDLMEQFIEHSADRILSDIRVDKLYEKESPFDWIREPKTETHSSKASMNNVMDMSASFGEAKFSTDLDF